MLRTYLTLVFCTVVATSLLPADELELTGERWVDMDYGSFLTGSIELPRPGFNFAQKGRAIRVGGDTRTVAHTDDCASLVFDTDLLRFAGGWTDGYLSLKNVVYQGSHGTGSHLGIVGEPVFVTRETAGWADPRASGDVFTDPRELPYGPLPKAWAHYKGLYRHGDKVILSYTVGETAVLEMPGLLTDSSVRALTRTLEVGPSPRPLVLQVAEWEGGQVTGWTRGQKAVAADPLLRSNPYLAPDAVPPVEPVSRDGLLAYWNFEKPWTGEEHAQLYPNLAGDRLHGKVSRGRYSVAGYGNGLNGSLWLHERRGGSGRMKFEDGQLLQFGSADVSVALHIRTSRGGTILSKHGDRWGAGAKSFFVREGRLGFAVGEVGEVLTDVRVGDRWHHVVLTIRAAEKRVCLYVDGVRAAEAVLEGLTADADDDHELEIGYTASDFPTGSPQSRYIGLLDEICFYDRVLDDAAVAQLASRAIHTPRNWAVGCAQAPEGSQWKLVDGELRLELPPSTETRRFQLVYFRGAPEESQQWAALFEQARVDVLSPLTRGGPPRWPTPVETEIQRGKDDVAYAVDVLTPPEDNPWRSWMRFGGVDFFSGGDRAALATWSGDVWFVEGLTSPKGKLSWRRVAAGLFQPLGVKIVDDVVYLCCRDQITILRDLNDDGEPDYYENFNNDHQVSEHFHEFAMDLQTDAGGDFYYVKAARHGKPGLLRQHGNIIRVAKDGSESELLAYGFRAPNGLTLNPDGSFVTSDQEGNFNVANKIAWVRRGEFHGNLWTIHPGGEPPTSFTQPLCWLGKPFDNSPSSQVWVRSSRWGPLEDRLVALSYGMGHVQHIFMEEVDGVMQGGAVRLPIPQFPTGIMRSRFHPGDGQLYLCGLFGWGGSRTYPGGFFRIRYTGKPICLPLELHATDSGVVVTFSEKLDARRSANPKRFGAERWNYAPWSKNYGSKEYRLSDGKVGRDTVEIRAVQISKDGKSLYLEIPDMQPVQQMEIRYRIQTAAGERVSQTLHHTVHRLGSHAPYRDSFDS